MQRNFDPPVQLAGHPMRRQLPANISVQPAKPARGDEDLKLFALSFTAFFICIYTLIF